MLKIPDTVFILIDVQGKLAQLMHEKETLFNNLTTIVRGIQLLQIPIVWMEQNPAKMGETIPQLKHLLRDNASLPKMSFSGWRDPVSASRIASLGRKQALIAGIESHVCVYQTARDMVDNGYEVEVVADAVSSRIVSSKQIALRKLRDCGVRLTTVEMALFELLETADHPAFRDVLKLVR